MFRHMKNSTWFLLYLYIDHCLLECSGKTVISTEMSGMWLWRAVKRFDLRLGATVLWRAISNLSGPITYSISQVIHIQTIKTCVLLNSFYLYNNANLFVAWSHLIDVSTIWRPANNYLKCCTQDVVISSSNCRWQLIIRLGEMSIHIYQ